MTGRTVAGGTRRTRAGVVLAAGLALAAWGMAQPAAASDVYSPAQKNDFLQTLIGYTGSAMACDRPDLVADGRARIVALIGHGMASGWLAGSNATLMRGTALREALARDAEAYRAAADHSDRPDCNAVAERLRALNGTADRLLE